MRNTDITWSINPAKLADSSAYTERHLTVAHFKRLGEYLADDSGEIFVRFDGLRGDGGSGRRLLKCHLNAKLAMECQTSFRAVPFEVEKEIVFCPVYNEEAMASVPEEYEAVLIDDEVLDLLTLVEDELILSLPIAVHAPDSPSSMRFGPEIIEETPDKPNPFTVLEGLKAKTDSKD
ncbi:YceD family protein [Pleionea sp. CnH1-48]|uniref:YceD family protein n=1 Tax=Pleionea sp. CnH1-48 TaxID=2954494 RepID=UPI002097AE49|nr:YceD family protein [Pleionea sp. CnH1-48]MCO7225862.1 YceD family protein [Pleionea sp. CnH1-48]